jgi:aspartyl protease family protein
MATGFMAGGRGRAMARHCMSFGALCLLPLAALAVDVGLAGVMGGKAMLMIDGGEPQAIRVGESLGGVKLISVQGDRAVVEVGGKARPLRVGQHAIGVPSADGSGRIVLNADGQGHFYATGTVNGVSVRFLVDTGATMISLGAADARRMGLDPARGVRAMTNTANGQAMVTKVQLDTVRIGDITLNNVDALIHQTDLPMALLGMSFLNRMDMQRDGSTLTLKKRY